MSPDILEPRKPEATDVKRYSAVSGAERIWLDSSFERLIILRRKQSQFQPQALTKKMLHFKCLLPTFVCIQCVNVDWFSGGFPTN